MTKASDQFLKDVSVLTLSTPEESVVANKLKQISTFWRKWRIVRDEYNGYEVQVKRWYYPIWLQVDQQDGVNSHTSPNHALEFALKCARAGTVIR